MRKMGLHETFNFCNLRRIKSAVIAILTIVLFATGGQSSFVFGADALPTQPPPAAGRPTMQGRRPGKSRIDTRLESLTKQLRLDENQRKETRMILETGQAEANRLWSDQQISPIDRMTKLHQLREDSRNKFRALLTPEQRTKYDQMLQNMTRAASQPTNNVEKSNSENQRANK
jgi:periplasmic protein CpxP/Spy